ncbi:peptidylprolyl isomerase [Aquibacillus sediminis]|uniref:peptidylprolyl isomerase n=1 Tax=Aquibacillus sediminis TaxID=2574734 RepID=UPI00110890EE|nr:peptidylprolyl isomerase [Aquibacillus sediminis]
MTRKYLWGVIILLLLTNLITIAIWMNERTGTHQQGTLPKNVDKNESVATIDDQTISYEKWMSSLESDRGKEVLKDLINQEVVFQLADQEGIEIQDKLIERELSFLFTMQDRLDQQEITKHEQQWREEIRYRLLLEELLTKDISVSEDEIVDYHTKFSEQYEFDESIQLSHIVVSNMDTAERVISELESGASFASLAREYSVDEDTRNSGGYLGFFASGSNYLSTEYYNQSQEMEEHTYSKPIEVGNNVAIIYLHRYLPAITFSYEEIKPQIRREIALEEMGEVISAEQLWDQFDIDWVYE